jgi:hypothetical protein
MKVEQGRGVVERAKSVFTTSWIAMMGFALLDRS